MGWTSANPQAVMNAAIPRVLRGAAIVVTGQAVVRAPVRTGRLRGSIAYKVFDDYAEVGTDVEYAPYIEYGTRRMAAQPFLRPAMDESRQDVAKIFRDEIVKEYRKYGK